MPRHAKAVAWFEDGRNRAEAVAMMAEASKIKTEDVEKSYDFFVKGKFFEPTGRVSRKRMDARWSTRWSAWATFPSCRSSG